MNRWVLPPPSKVERALGKRHARISRKHKLRSRERDPAGSHDPAAFKFLLEGLPLEERCTQASGNGHILEDAFLPLIRRATISSLTLWQSDQVSWINSSNRQAVWKRALVRWNARAEP